MKNQPSDETLESMSQAVWYNKWTMKKFLKYIHGDILEVGCGIGNFTGSLIAYGNVWAIDKNDEYLNKTKKKVNGKIKVGLGDIEKGTYFFNNRTFDSIVCINVLEHVEKDDTALENLNYLLNDGGFLIILVPAHKILFGKIDKAIGHFRRYEKKDIIEKLKKANFSILKIRKLNFLGAIGWFFAGKFFGSSTISENQIKLFNIIGSIVLPIENIVEPPIGTSILIIAQQTI